MRRYVRNDKIVYFEKGLHHRPDGPAIEWYNGRQEWKIHGVLHREDGPAIICPFEGNVWYVNGLLHRTDGPALVSNRHEIWWFHGKRHREDGPAYINKKGAMQWFKHGKWHNINGPAIIWENDHYGDRIQWYIDGIRYTFEDWIKITGNDAVSMKLIWF